MEHNNPDMQFQPAVPGPVTDSPSHDSRVSVR